MLGRSTGVPAWMDHASRTYWACEQASRVAERVPSPSGKPGWPAGGKSGAQTCSGSMLPSFCRCGDVAQAGPRRARHPHRSVEVEAVPEITAALLPRCQLLGSRLLGRAARLAAQRDLAGDDDLALQAVDRHDRARLKPLVAPERARVDLFADTQLDLPLRCDAELLQEAAHRKVEGLFVHQSGIRPSPVNSPRASSNVMSRGGRITSDSISSSSGSALPSLDTSSSIWLQSSLKPVSSPCSTALTARLSSSLRRSASSSGSLNWPSPAMRTITPSPPPAREPATRRRPSQARPLSSRARRRPEPRSSARRAGDRCRRRPSRAP